MEHHAKNSSENFFQDLKDVGIKHFNNKLEWTKLLVVEKSSKIIAALASFVVLGVIAFFLIAYASLMLGFLFTSIFGGNTFYGFGLVAVILLLVLLLVNHNKKKWIEMPVMNLVIHILLENDGESKDI